MFKYFKESFRRKKARRITREYPPTIDTVNIKDIGEVEFAKWSNPIAPKTELDSEMVAYFKQFIKEGDLVIDIGANIGDTTVPMALCAGKKGLSLAFDPNPYVFKILQKNATLNPGKVNIVPLPYAISKEEEEFFFISSEASFGNGGISTTKESKHGRFVHSEKIKGVNLYEFIRKEYPQWLEKLSFIKIDTEGYDKDIIKSVSELISLTKPIIIAESFGNASDEDKMELYDMIHRHNYEIYFFQDFNINAAVEKINNRKEMLKWKETINICGKPIR